jgi:hypothetical protein
MIGMTYRQPRIRHITEIRIHNLDIHAHLAKREEQDGEHKLGHSSSQAEGSGSPISEYIPRRKSQGSAHSHSLRDVREIAEDRINGSGAGEVAVIEEEPDGDLQSGTPGLSELNQRRSISSSSLGRITRSPRLIPRRASSNETITEQPQPPSPSHLSPQAGSRSFGARPGLATHGHGHGRSRSRLIVPRPAAIPNEAVEERGDSGVHGVDIAQGPGQSEVRGKETRAQSQSQAHAQSRARSGSISSLRSAHHPYHGIHTHHSHNQASTSLGAGTGMGMGGRRERASTIVSQYAIDTAGHVTLTDELGYEKKDTHATTGGNKATNASADVGMTSGSEARAGGEKGMDFDFEYNLDEAVLREEKELVRCFVTMVLVEDLRAALKAQEEEEEQDEEEASGKVSACTNNGLARAIDGVAGKNGSSRRLGETKMSRRDSTGVGDATGSVSRAQAGHSMIPASSPEPRSRRGSQTISQSKELPGRSNSTSTPPKEARPKFPSSSSVPSPNKNNKTSAVPGSRIRPPASRQNTLRTGSASASYPGNTSPTRRNSSPSAASPNRLARLASPPNSRLNSPPTSPSLRPGTFVGGKMGSRRASSETTLNGHEEEPANNTLKPATNVKGADSPQRNDTKSKKTHEQKTRPISPFYISPIHRKSLYPTFSGISVASDYADWVGESAGEAAGHRVLLEAWYESRKGVERNITARGETANWRKLEGFGGVVDLTTLREVAEDVSPGSTFEK